METKPVNAQLPVLITGASRGIGRAIAERFATGGHPLVLTSRQETKLGQTVQELRNSYPAVIIRAKAFDLSDHQETKALASWCLQETIPVILVNNAGYFEPGSVHNEPEGVLESQLRHNLFSAYDLTRALLPAMMKEKAPAPRHIFNMCSIASLKAYANGGAYSISKFALYGFSKNLREELKEHNIKVTSVMPGAVMTDSWEGFDNSNKRIMEADDVAQLVYAAAHLSPQACPEEIILRPQLGDL